MRLYDYLPSGNGYKVRLLLAHLEIPYELVQLDIVKKETRTPEFLTINPNGRIPALQLDDNRVLWESNAIIWYLAAGTSLRPNDAWLQAEAMQWMCFEQYSHEPYIATVRHWIAHLGRADDPAWAEEIRERRQSGLAALSVMEKHLASRHFFVADCYTVADIALFAYTHVADEGGFDLTAYPAVRGWIDRVRKQSGHVPITYMPNS